MTRSGCGYPRRRVTDTAPRVTMCHMARMSIQIPDDLRRLAEARAAEAGHGSLDEYIEALLRADLDAVDLEDDDVEALLLQRLDSTEPPIEVTPQFVEAFKRRQVQRRQRPAGGRP